MKDERDYLDEAIDESRKDPVFDRLLISSEAVRKLVELRVKRGLTQEQVAVSRARVSEIEANPTSVTFSRLALYASVLGATLQVSEPADVESTSLEQGTKRGRPVGTTKGRRIA